jgi:hypothetical protein
MAGFYRITLHGGPSPVAERKPDHASLLRILLLEIMRLDGGKHAAKLTRKAVLRPDRASRGLRVATPGSSPSLESWRVCWRVGYGEISFPRHFTQL